ncbi:MAG: hypothetical protein J0I41_19940 [Filimonas sp.]|nr:hypothetical protein [Filimonas sp.]
MLLKNNIPWKYVFGKIKYELLIVSVYTIAIEIFYHNTDTKLISIPIAVLAIMGTVISLLLAFRSNQAYDRWWEARIIWGAIVNDSRSLSRQVLTFINDAGNPQEVAHFKSRFIKRQIAWCYALGQSLRKTDPLKGLDRLVSRRDLHVMGKYDNVPAAILEQHAKDMNYALHAGWVNEYQQVEMDRTFTRLCDSMGKCERIKNTVFPATYSLYIHFALNFFLLLLPFALVDAVGLVMVPMVIAIAASFLLIEKMAIHLQDPFESKPTDTPMTAIARNIEKDLKQMIEEENSIAPEVPVVQKFYIL